MAYSTSAPPRLIAAGIGASPRLWVYTSADAIATVNTSGYFSNGAALGLKVNDVVIVVDTATPTVTLAVVIDVTAGGQADISDGTSVSVTDSD
jgi:hypothetical protein